MRTIIKTKNGFFSKILKTAALVVVFAITSSALLGGAYADAKLDLFDEFSVVGEPSLDGFSVLSGVTKREESTFDSIRTIVGAAPRNTSIIISVYRYNENFGKTDKPLDKPLDKQSEKQQEMFTLVSSVSATVGQSEVFNKTIELETGKNFVLVSAVKGEHKTALTALISRKNIEIKKELEQSVVLYGKSLLRKETAD
jgi:hypothetical protein